MVKQFTRFSVEQEVIGVAQLVSGMLCLAHGVMQQVPGVIQ